jgi:FkbM family methyltransferase
MYTIHHERWDKDNGNFHLVANYPLNEDSWVIELGGFKGHWSNRIISTYKCNILILEPVPEFCKFIQDEIGSKDKVRIENNGISTENKLVQLSFNDDASSQYINHTSSKIDVQCYTLEHYLEKYNIEKVDLMQVNIEGEEYPLFEKWIQSDILKKFKYLQIQYHEVGDDFRERKNKIEEGLRNLGFENQWDYDMVFTSWKNKNLD